jgi:hypothetical protein
MRKPLICLDPVKGERNKTYSDTVPIDLIKNIIVLILKNSSNFFSEKMDVMCSNGLEI